MVVDVGGDFEDAFSAVVDRVERGHVGQKRLGRADVRGRFFPANVLFASLKGHTKSHVAVFVFGDSDDPTGDGPLIVSLCGEIGGMGASESNRNTESLGGADDDV